MDNKLKFGDLLYRKKMVVEHAGVYLGNNSVLHNSPSNAIEITSLENYAQGKGIKVVSAKDRNAELIKGRAREAIKECTQYNLATNNCEHLVNFCTAGKKYSPQLRVGMVAGTIAAALSLKTGKGKPILMAAFGAAGGTLLWNSLKDYDYEIPAQKNSIAI